MSSDTTHGFRSAILLVLVCCAVLTVGAAAATYSSGKIYPTSDGMLKEGGNNVNQTFAELLAGNGDSFLVYGGGSSSQTRLLGAKETDRYNYTRFWGGTFAYAPALLPNDTITSAAVCLRAPATGQSTNLLGDLNLTLVGLSPSDPTSLTATDYSTYGRVPYAQNYTTTTWAANTYNCFNMTPAGIANVSKTGYTNVATVFANFVDGNDAGITWGEDLYSSFNWYQSAYSGTTYDPYLEYTWDTYEAPADTENLTAAFSVDRTTAGYGAPLVFTDASTGVSITDWYWEFGDGNVSTSQNPIFKYDIPGTYTVNLSVTNSTATDSENKTAYITIDGYPDTYLNPYTKMVPWYAQGAEPFCGGCAAGSAAMILRYQELGTTPSAVQEPYVRNVSTTIDGLPVYYDTHVNYTPSVASLYWPFDEAPGDHYNYTALAEVMKTGYNLADDQITSKYNNTEFYYPTNETYLDAHRYNQIGDYTTRTGISDASWTELLQNVSVNGVVVVLIDTYSNGGDNSTQMTLDNGQEAVVFQDPTGSETNGHFLAVVGYNRSLDQAYVLNSWGEVRYSGAVWTKMGALNKAYWVYDDGDTRQAYIIPRNITVNEVLPEMPAPPAADPPEGTEGGLDSYTNVLLHFNGTANQTTTVDEKGHPITMGGGAQLDTGRVKYGSAAMSIYSIALSPNTTIEASADLIQTGDYTIETFVSWPIAGKTDSAFYGSYGGSFPQYWIWDGGAEPLGIYDNAAYHYISQSLFPDQYDPLHPAKWWHLAVVRNTTLATNNTFVYVDGNRVAEWSNPNQVFDASKPITVGRSGSTGGYYYTGGLDEFRISNVARYAANFTPPQYEFNNTPYSVVSDFDQDYTTGVFPLTVSFTDTSIGSPTTFTWAINNIEVATTRNMSYTFSTGGNFSVNHTAFDGVTNSSKQSYVEIWNQTHSDFIANVTSGVNTLDVGYTDLSTNATVYSYLFGDGNTSAVRNATHHYDYPGSYTVVLNASNPYAYDHETKVAYIKVYGANFTADTTSGALPLTVAFTDTSTGSPTAWYWDFGDGNTSTLQNPSHIYTSYGLFTVKLNATISGVNGTKLRADYIYGGFALEPEANFAANATVGAAPFAVKFTDTSTNGPSSWAWEFGDGNVSTEQNPSFVYNISGTYTVNLTATNPIGSNTLVRTDYIEVLEPGTTVVNFTASPTSGKPGILVQFTDHSIITDPTDLYYNWSFGDGVYTTEPFSEVQGDVQHVYAYAGVYSVNLSITNIVGTSFMYRQQYISVSQSQDQLNKYPPDAVTIHIQDFFGAPVTDATVKVQGITTSTGNWDYIVTLLGLPLSETPINTETMQETTDSNGDTVFLMIKTGKYNVTTTSPGRSYPITYISPNEKRHTIVANVNATGWWGSETNPQLDTNISVTKSKLNATYGTINVTYTDPNNVTTGGVINIYRPNTTRGGANVLVATMPVTGASFTNWTGVPVDAISGADYIVEVVAQTSD